jgi:hypothetical protein
VTGFSAANQDLPKFLCRKPDPFLALIPKGENFGKSAHLLKLAGQLEDFRSEIQLTRN